jgi:hypothetical protein
VDGEDDVDALGSRQSGCGRARHDLLAQQGEGRCIEVPFQY